MRRTAGLLLLAVVVACGEPAVGLAVPDRRPGQVLLDTAGILDDSVAAALRGSPLDIVALTLEDREASLGLADRAGRKVLSAWDADIVLVAVAEPGHFASREQGRRRYFGVVPAGRSAVPGSLREHVVSDVVPPVAADNDWSAVFRVAAAALTREVGP